MKICSKNNILILGGYGYGNTGDEAQLNETLNIMNKYFSEYNVIVLTPNLEYTRSIHNCNVDYAPREAFFDSHTDPNTIYWLKNPIEEKNMIKKMRYIYFQAFLKKYFNIKIRNKKIDHIINLLMSSKLVYFSGGGYLTGSTLSRLFDGCLFISIAKLFNIPVVLSGQTIGLFRNNFDRKIAKNAFGYAKLITLRDPEDSPKALNEIGINNYEVMFDDALFCSKDNDKDRIDKLLESSGINNKRYIAMNIHYWGIKSDSEKNILLTKLKSLVKVIKSTFNNISILLIPMVPSDYNDANEFLEYINEENIYLLNYDYDFKKVRSIIGNSLICITMKHHPIIFAIGEKIPVISTSYSSYYKHKNYGALKIFNLERYNIELESKNYLELFEKQLINIKNDYNSNIEYLSTLFNTLKSKKENFIYEIKKIIVK